MAWSVEYTDEFERWWETLSGPEQVQVARKVELLETYGPTLKRPHADVIVTSSYANMKELRAQAEGHHLRVLYCFNPQQTALLLVGGDKTGNPRWYEQMVPLADLLYERHLAELEDERRRGGKRGRKDGKKL